MPTADVVHVSQAQCVGGNQRAARTGATRSACRAKQFEPPRIKGLDTGSSCRGILDETVKGFIGLGGSFARAARNEKLLLGARLMRPSASLRDLEVTGGDLAFVGGVSTFEVQHPWPRHALTGGDI